MSSNKFFFLGLIYPLRTRSDSFCVRCFLVSHTLDISPFIISATCSRQRQFPLWTFHSLLANHCHNKSLHSDALSACALSFFPSQFRAHYKAKFCFATNRFGCSDVIKLVHVTFLFLLTSA